jgi:serine/threonine-protein kinase
MSIAATSETLAPGAALREGALVIEEVLSQSRFAITYRGRDTRLARAVAIKEYFPLGCARENGLVQPRAALTAEFERAKNQFLEEARVLAQFHHPGIVSVFDFFAGNNTTYMVMEFLAGHTLEAVLQNGPLPVEVAVNYVARIGEALQAVHEAALLHCDIKPENVMVCPTSEGGAGERTKSERVVLVDFGLTKRLDESRSYGTRRLDDAGHFGTPGYAPIEQYTHSTQIGAYTDVYALGATLYRLLTGMVPASAADRAAGAEWTPPHRLNPRVSHSLSQAIAWAMAMTPAARPSTVAAWMERLHAVEEQERGRAALLGVLQARLRQLERAPQSAVPPVSARQTTAHPAVASSAVASSAVASSAVASSAVASSAVASSAVASSASVLPAAPPEYLTDDAGCLHACFVGCLVVWFITAALALVGWAVRFAMAGS